MELEFKPVVAGDVDRLRPFYGMKPNKTYDNVFLDSFLWEDYYHVQCAVSEGRAALWFTKKGRRASAAMPLCREEDLFYFFQQMADYFPEVLHKPFYISLADGETVQYLGLDPAFFEAEEQVDLKNYLYSGEELRKLEGKKLAKKRDHLNGFKRIYEGRREYGRLCCSDRRGVWQFMECWRQYREEVGAMELSLDHEVARMHDTLKNYPGLCVKMIGVYIDGQLEAFTIGSLNVREDMAVIHVEEANPEVRRLCQFINRQFLINEPPQAKLVNQKNSVETEGLRKTETSYYPIGFTREYTVRER